MSSPKHGLGRGLNALIGSDTKEAQEARKQQEAEAEELRRLKNQKGILQVPVDQIEADVNQPRKQFHDETIHELAESIKTYGVIQPLLVQKTGSHYTLIAGERRLRAAKEAGLTTVPVQVKEYSAQEALELSLIENIQREDLNPVEEAQAYRRLMTEYHLTQEDAARRVGRSRASVANTLRLLNLDDEVLSYVASGELSEGHAKVLLSVTSREKQCQLCRRVLEQGLSVRQLEKLVQSSAHPKKKEPLPQDAASLAYEKAGRKLTQTLGTKVSIIPGKKKGRIEIEYYSEEDLERLLELLSSRH